MSTKIHEYFNDGANYQAQAVLAALKGKIGDGIESSWNKEFSKYDAEVTVSRWENGREQGYVSTLRSKNFSRQLNIAWFEHRNSDPICAIRWEQVTMNSPTIDTAKFGDVYKDKWDTSHAVSYGKFSEMAEWISDQFENFWDETSETK